MNLKLAALQSSDRMEVDYHSPSGVLFLTSYKKGFMTKS